MLDFGASPPEINSARMYAGPGPGSMLAAAAAWQSLAEELTSAASGYGWVVSTLASEPWTGPSSTSMGRDVGPGRGRDVPLRHRLDLSFARR